MKINSVRNIPTPLAPASIRGCTSFGPTIFPHRAIGIPSDVTVLVSEK